MIGGGGELGLPELQPAEGVKNTYYHAFTAQELDSIVRGNGCTVLYIQTLDDILCRATPICLPTSWRRRRAARRFCTA